MAKNHKNHGESSHCINIAYATITTVAVFVLRWYSLCYACFALAVFNLLLEKINKIAITAPNERFENA